MIIEAGTRFVCTHRYIVHVAQMADAGDHAKQLFMVCEHCGHRVEQLPIPQDCAFGRVIAFPPPRVNRYVARAPERHNDPPPLLSA